MVGSLDHMLTSGHLTWEWDKAIRGYTHPLMFAALYKLLQLLNMDSAWAVVSTPPPPIDNTHPPLPSLRQKLPSCFKLC